MPELDLAHTSSYTIDHHKHRFAAWAASLAASKGKEFRFPVEFGRVLLERCGFAEISEPEQLPTAELIDANHRQWRSNVVEAAKAQGKSLTHGIAAKLINVYLKSRFVCGGYHAHERVRNLHPPIDSVLLKTLAKLNFGGYGKRWIKHPWTTLDSGQYEQLIDFIRESLKGEPLWKIEEYWKGNQ
jgi:hypothetical protein